jgi:hypothetical protein
MSKENSQSNKLESLTNRPPNTAPEDLTDQSRSSREGDIQYTEVGGAYQPDKRSIIKNHEQKLPVSVTITSLGWKKNPRRGQNHK